MSKINVTKSSMPSYEEYCEEIKSIWDTVHLTNMGPIHNRLKAELKNVLKVKNVELFLWVMCPDGILHWQITARFGAFWCSLVFYCCF